MRPLALLVRRNIKLYFSDRTSVFFSLLGALIAVFIVLLFMKSSILDTMVASYQGLVDRATCDDLLNCWIVASAAVIASATTGLGAMRQYVADRESGRWRDFLISPVTPATLTLGYLLAATIVSVIMTTIVYLLGTVYCLVGGATLELARVVEAWGWIMLCSVSFTALMGFVTSLLTTVASYAGISTVIGVLFGFLSETYVQAGALSTHVTDVLNSLPFAQATALVRGAYLDDGIAALPADVHDPTRATMGIDLTVGSTVLPTWLIIAVLAGCAVVFTVLASVSIGRAVKGH
ncbi:MAG: ABC transporter permease [Propionibacteriaceae bacterium]|jgi:multidrug/hemolysin transport system permease protein|nr:ABC transporter permease [Propionibacteriaceae bacterium]